MKLDSIQQHLKPYSILQKRRTTINHAFASAIALVDEYSWEKLAKAMQQLGQEPDGELSCLYCGTEPATGWDHVVGLVKNGAYSGFGHTIGNLVLCCQRCNSRKGNKDWRTFLSETIQDVDTFQARQEVIERHLAQDERLGIGIEGIRDLFPQELVEFLGLRDEILRLMQDADIVATDIRRKVKDHLDNTVILHQG